jgi:hypothetical protein
VIDPRPYDDIPLPSPIRSITGHVACNEPLIQGGLIVAYCQVWVKPGKSHKGRHRVEWS